MKTTLEHRTKLKEILDYAFNYALGAMEWEGEPQAPVDWSAETGLHFYSKSNEGFKKAQKLLIEERTEYQQQLRDATSQLKKARGLRIKLDIERLSRKISIIETRLSVLAHVADGIAWILLGGQIHRARRLHMQETEQKFLDSSNIAHAIKTADIINENPLDFALLSDIGGIVQIGDLLVRRPTSVEIIELKEGGVNDTITKLFDTTEQAGQSIADLDLSMFDAKTVKQAQRMIRQREKKANADELITNDIGIDPVTKRPMVVSTPLIETEQYHEELADLRAQLKTKTWAYTCIESCLHIGMYRDESIQTLAPTVIESLLKGSTSNYRLLDWLDIINQVTEPIFAKHFDQDFVLDFLTGQVKVIMGLNFDALIDTFNVFGLQAEWMTTKETTKLKSQGNNTARQMVTINNRSIRLVSPNKDDITNVLGGGVMSKILFDNIYPSNIALTMLNSVRPKLPDIDE
jgi:hypothetical protein